MRPQVSRAEEAQVLPGVKRRPVSQPLSEPPKLSFSLEASYAVPLSPAGSHHAPSYLLSLTRAIMPQDQKSEHCKLEQGLQAQRETHGQEGAQVPGGEEEEAMRALSASAANSSSCSPLTLESLIMEEGSTAGAYSSPQSPQRTCTFLSAISAAQATMSAEGPSSQIEEEASSQVEEGAGSPVKEGSSAQVEDGDGSQVEEGACSELEEGDGSQVEEGAGSPVEERASSQVEEGAIALRALPDTEPWRRNRLGQKVIHLVKFLLLKNRRKEPTTKAEILSLVIRNYNSHFPVIFRRALEVMQLIFGIDMKPAGPTGHSYVLVPTLGLTYDGMPPGGVPSAPKTSLLILVLGVIFLEGNCAREEKIWKVLGMIGVYAEQEHFIYGEPRRLLTQDWVQERYLVYRQGSSSLPGCSELLWGPRAHAETSKMKVLGFLAKASGTDPSSFPSHYAEALREEEERGRAPVAVRARTRAVGCIHSRATSSTFSCPLGPEGDPPSVLEEGGHQAK
ncbi:melanoma-associated antigen 10-like [Loxodonta africana]|uniref:melanoma-associated antigen 10-like n=1 Tax=Loxodonta africana TaxID=9785 RepID=UPI000C812FC5|nr:melanoma-associated antigen 10-like [Loxodonta africana]